MTASPLFLLQVSGEKGIHSDLIVTPAGKPFRIRFRQSGGGRRTRSKSQAKQDIQALMPAIDEDIRDPAFVGISFLLLTVRIADDTHSVDCVIRTFRNRHEALIAVIIAVK